MNNLEQGVIEERDGWKDYVKSALGAGLIVYGSIGLSNALYSDWFIKSLSDKEVLTASGIAVFLKLGCNLLSNPIYRLKEKVLELTGW